MRARSHSESHPTGRDRPRFRPQVTICRDYGLSPRRNAAARWGGLETALLLPVFLNGMMWPLAWWTGKGAPAGPSAVDMRVQPKLKEGYLPELVAFEGRLMIVWPSEEHFYIAGVEHRAALDPLGG
jgi:hypothetical protein